MALSAREKWLVTLAIGALGIGGAGFFGAMPAFNAMAETKNKLSSAQQEVGQLQTQEAAMQQDLQRYKQSQAIPPELTIRTFEPTSMEQNIKEMLDEVIRLGTQRGNAFISLEPVAIAVPPPSKPNEPKRFSPPGAVPKDIPADGKANNTATAVAPTAGGPVAAVGPDGQPLTASDEPDPNTLLKVFGYNLAFRGNYDNLLNFLASLNQHKELVEVVKVTLQNEGGPQRVVGTTVSALTASEAAMKASKPIKMTLDVRLIMQPSPSSLAGGPTTAPSPTTLAAPASGPMH
jgi:hypothetical protein